MRWITFLILLYLMTALQAAGLGGFPHHNDIWPRIEYLAILAIFYALYAAEPSAPLAGLICGIAWDIITKNVLIGTSAVPLALTVLLVVKIRLSIFREHAISQILITLLAILIFAALSIITRLIISAPLIFNSIWSDFAHTAANAFYSALVAPIFFWLFFRIQPLLGFSTHGPRSRVHDTRR
jgi:rod shape-determining protein MreD